MSIYDSTTYGNIQDILVSIRSTLNTPIRPNAVHFEMIQDIAMEIEGLRFILSQIRRNGDFDQNQYLKTRLKSKAIALLESVAFQEVLAKRSFKYRPPLSSDRSIPDELQISDGMNVTIEQAVVYLINALDRLMQPTLFENDKQNTTDVAKLRRIIPNQKIAPVHFEINDGRLKIAHQLASAPSPNSEYARSARNILIENGQQLLNQLRNSNCDPRLFDTVNALQEKLNSCDDIIQLGIMNIGVDLAGKQFSDELPPIVTAMLQTQTSGISLYASQFPDWQKFTEAAALTELHENDIAQISKAAIDIINDLEKSPDLVDQEVPKTIRMLQLLIADPKKATKRAAFAVVRTIENLVAKVFGYGLNFIGETATKTSQKASNLASQAVIYGLLWIALQSATGMTNVTAKLAESAWMGNAAKIIERQIETLSGSKLID